MMCTINSIFSSTTPHNFATKKKIVEEILETPGVKYTEEEIKG